MDMIWHIGLVLVGFSLLIVGGDKLVEGASALARRFKMSDMFIGIAVVGFGTSVPELMAMGSAMMTDKPDIAMGNILGSNIANVGLVLAVGLLMTSQAKGLRNSRIDFGLMMMALSIFAVVFYLDMLSFVGAWILLAGLVAYLTLSMKLAQPSENDEGVVGVVAPLWKSILVVVFGLLCLVFGADWLIAGASSLALTFGVSERVIGITLVAVGTSLPELGAVVAAARQQKFNMVAGNIMGSNAFNVLGGGGVSALLGYVPVAAFKTDLWVMFGFVGLMMPLFFLQRRPYKVIGGVLLLAYVGYIGFCVI